jgi:quinolinate synthase
MSGTSIARILLVAAGLCVLPACSDNKVQFLDGSLKDNTHVERVHDWKDKYGLTYVTLYIRSTTDSSQYVDCYITFRKDAQLVERLGPQTVIIHPREEALINFNSTQQADDYFITLSNAR